MSFSTEGIPLSAFMPQELLALLGASTETAAEEDTVFFDENLVLKDEKIGQEKEDFKEILNMAEESPLLSCVVPAFDFQENKENSYTFDLPQEPEQFVEFYTGKQESPFSIVQSSSQISSSSLFFSERESESIETPYEEESDKLLSASHKKDLPAFPFHLFKEEGEEIQKSKETQRFQKFSSDFLQGTFFPKSLKAEEQKAFILSSIEASSFSLREEKKTELETLDSLKSEENTPPREDKLFVERLQEKTLSSAALEVKTEEDIKSSFSKASGSEKPEEEKILFEQKDLLQKGIGRTVEEKNFPASLGATQSSKSLGSTFSANMPTVLRQISENCAGMIRGQGADGSSFVRFQLHPESLGVLEIHLVFHEEALSLHFAGEPSTMDLLQRHALQLAEALHQQGFQLNTDQMNFGSLSWKEGMSHSGEHGENASQFFGGEKEETLNQPSLDPSLSSAASTSEHINILIDTTLTQLTTPGEIALCL